MTLTKEQIAERAATLAVQLNTFIEEYIVHVGECYDEDGKDNLADKMREITAHNDDKVRSLLAYVCGDDRTCMLALLKACESGLTLSVMANTPLPDLET